MSGTAVRMVIDGAVMADMLRSPGGIVMRDLTDRATRVQLAAQSQAKSTTKGSGRLAAGITKRPARIGLNPLIMVGCWNIPYAIYVHEGTKPHIIRARNAKALAFKWAANPSTHPSGLSFFASVNHPGTKPNRFLSDNLHLAVA